MKSFRQVLAEAKATYCGRCGTTHVPPSKGGTCPAMKEEVVEEGLADDVLAVAKGISPNARMRPSVADQKKKRDELIAKREKDAANRPKEAPHTPYEKYPLGGYDPVSRRSYSEEVEIQESEDEAPRHQTWAVKPKNPRHFMKYFPPHRKDEAEAHAKATGGKLLKVDQKGRVMKEDVDLVEVKKPYDGPKGPPPPPGRTGPSALDGPAEDEPGDTKGMKAARKRIMKASVKEEVSLREYVEQDLQESAMSDIHQTIGDHLDKHIAKYNAGKLGHDQFGTKVLAAHKAVAKEHGLQHKDAVKLVNDYVEGSLKEGVELVIDANALDEAVVSSKRPSTIPDHHYSTSAGSHPTSHVESVLGLSRGSVSKEKPTYIKHGDVHMKTTPAGKHVIVTLARKHGKFGQDTSSHDAQLKSIQSSLAESVIEEISLREYVESDGLVEAYTGKGNHRPGWMLRADSALAAKIKEKQKARAALSKATKQPIKKDNDHE